MSKQHATMSFASIGDCVVDRYSLEKENYLGGTAFNSAVVASKLGANATIFSAIGTDAFGKAYLTACEESGINILFVAKEKGETSTIVIETSDKNDPKYLLWELHVLKDYLMGKDAIEKLSKMDIAKIALFTPMRKLFDQFAETPLPHTLKVADFSGVSEYTDNGFSMTNYLNQFDIFVKSTTKDDKKTLKMLKNIAKHYHKTCLILLGRDGSICFDKEKIYVHPSQQVKVVDTNGAGDAYIAAFCYFLSVSKSVPFAMEQATKNAVETISHYGGSRFLFTG